MGVPGSGGGRPLLPAGSPRCTTRALAGLRDHATTLHVPHSMKLPSQSRDEAIMADAASDLGMVQEVASAILFVPFHSAASFWASTINGRRWCSDPAPECSESVVGPVINAIPRDEALGSNPTIVHAHRFAPNPGPEVMVAHASTSMRPWNSSRDDNLQAFVSLGHGGPRSWFCQR